MSAAELDDAVDELLRRGVERIHVLGWRDLDDPEAGGSELHAHQFMRRWAERGLDVVQRTSAVSGSPTNVERDGYRSVRRGGRYSVFPRTIASEGTHRSGRSDALVEIWNGVPWWSPLWYRRPRITIVHHVHREMWDDAVSPVLAPIGRAVETRLAPPAYRGSTVVTPSDSTRADLIGLGLRPARVVVVPNGVPEIFAPGGMRTREPSVVAVSRIAPVKRLDRLVDAVAVTRRSQPATTLTIVGDGPARSALERHIDAVGARSWVTLTGRVDQAEIVDHYRRAWIVASASHAEGWGLSLTEAAACGTPAVATDIDGHRCSVVDGVTGVLAPIERLGTAIADVLSRDSLRGRLADAALTRARTLTWDATALGITTALLREVPEGPSRATPRR